jgi:signal peptidase I
MSPALRDGDWLLVDPDAYRAAPARPGQLVLAESASGPLVKRVGGTSGDGVVHLVGDAPSDGEHRHDVTIPVSAISGRPWFRYWPPSRIGRVS